MLYSISEKDLKIIKEFCYKNIQTDLRSYTIDQTERVTQKNLKKAIDESDASERKDLEKDLIVYNIIKKW